MEKTEELVELILSNIDNLRGIKPEDIPDIGLYMDQVTSLVEENLEQEKRYENDKILTKTMINNYTKDHLLPPPDRKKYSRDHILIMVLIYYYKSLLSISDIQELFRPLTENHFRTEDGITLSQIVDRLMALSEDQTKALKDDVRKKAGNARRVFADERSETDPDDAVYLTMLALINELFSDIYLKKKVMEYLIDQFAEDYKSKEAAAKKKR